VFGGINGDDTIMFLDLDDASAGWEIFLHEKLPLKTGIRGTKIRCHFNII